MSEPDWRDDRIQSAIDGRNPTVLAELDAAFAVIGDVPGYSLALADAVEAACPVWLYDSGRWFDPAIALGPTHGALRAAIAGEIEARRDAAGFRLTSSLPTPGEDG